MFLCITHRISFNDTCRMQTPLASTVCKPGAPAFAVRMFSGVGYLRASHKMTLADLNYFKRVHRGRRHGIAFYPEFDDLQIAFAACGVFPRFNTTGDGC
jgi:hypothetical protein